MLAGERRRSLLAWAARASALLIEDDYDAVLRYDREPVRALQGLDPERVVYTGSISNTLAPGLRLAWIVAPGDLVEEATRVKLLLDGGSPVLDQLAFERLLTTGAYDRHLRRARPAYRRRRDRLLESLERELPDNKVSGIAAGLHLVLELPDGADDVVIAGRAAEVGINVEPIAKYHTADRHPRRALVLGYGQLNESAIPAAVRALAAVVGQS